MAVGYEIYLHTNTDYKVQNEINQKYVLIYVHEYIYLDIFMYLHLSN
jgi:hypothetical protein